MPPRFASRSPTVYGLANLRDALRESDPKPVRIRDDEVAQSVLLILQRGQLLISRGTPDPMMAIFTASVPTIG